MGEGRGSGAPLLDEEQPNKPWLAGIRGGKSMLPFTLVSKTAPPILKPPSSCPSTEEVKQKRNKFQALLVQERTTKGRKFETKWESALKLGNLACFLKAQLGESEAGLCPSRATLMAAMTLPILAVSSVKGSGEASSCERHHAICQQVTS